MVEQGNSVVQQLWWNSGAVMVEQCGGTVMVEQCGGTVWWISKTVSATVLWNSGTVMVEQ